MFNPATPLDWLMHVIDKLDLVLIMSVNPGFGGQKFIPHALEKLKAARKLIDASMQRTGRAIRLEVDGGVKVDNIRAIAEAGADTFVAGSAIFDAPDYGATIAQMRASWRWLASRGRDGIVDSPAVRPLRSGGRDPSTANMNFDVSDLGLPPALAGWRRAGEWRWQRPS